MNNINILGAQIILKHLECDFIESIPQHSSLFVDDMYLSTGNYKDLEEHLSSIYLEYFSKVSLLSWLLKSKAPTRFTLGFDSHGEPLPFVLDTPFSKRPYRSFYLYEGMCIEPCNMVLTAGDNIYTKVTEELFDKVKNTYDITVSELILNRCKDAMEIYIVSKEDLEIILNRKEN